NSARSFGPALVSGDFSSYWVYVAGPLTGAVIAVGFAFLLRGRGGDPISYAAGSGALGPGALQARHRLAQAIEHREAAPPRDGGEDAPPAAAGERPPGRAPSG